MNLYVRRIPQALVQLIFWSVGGWFIVSYTLENQDAHAVGRGLGLLTLIRWIIEKLGADGAIAAFLGFGIFTASLVLLFGERKTS